MATFDETAVLSARKPVGRVTVYWSGRGTDTYDVTANSLNSIHAEVAELIGDVVNNVTAAPSKWFQCDDINTLDEMVLAPGDAASAALHEFGWWGAEQSGAVLASGGYAFTNPQVLYVKSDKRPISTLVVSGCSGYSEYPVDFDVDVYSGPLGLVLEHHEAVTGNTGVNWTTNITAVPDATRIVLTVTRWSAPNAVVKISEVLASVDEVYDGDEIISFSVLEEMELKDATLPTGSISANELELELNNVDDKFFPGNTAAPLHAVVKRGRRIEVELGFYVDGTPEYKSMGTFFSGDWEVSELGTSASTTARDRMGQLRDSTVTLSGLYVNETVGELAERVLDNAVLAMSDLTYTIDSALYDTAYTIPYAWFDKVSHFEALKLLSEAALGRVYSDRDDVIQFKAPLETAPAYSYELTADNYFERTQPENTEDVSNQVIAVTQPLTLTTGETLYSSSEQGLVAGQIYTFDFVYKSTPCSDASAAFVTVDGSAFTGSITSSVLTALGGSVTVTCTTGGLCKIAVTGTKYEVIGGEEIEYNDGDSQFSYGIRRFELKKNPFMQTTALTRKAAASLLASYKDPAKDIALNWRGNPSIELGAVVRCPEYVKGAVSVKGDFSVYKQKVTYDGGISATFDGRKVGSSINAVYQDTDGATAVGQDTDGSSPEIILQN